MIKNLLNLIKRENLKKYKIPKTAQQTIPFEYITKDGLIEVEKDSYVSICSVDNINYSLARENDQEDIFNNYCTMLNSLDYYVQWFLTNDVLDTKEVMNIIPEYHNTHRDDLAYYRNWITDISVSKKAADRKRYLVIQCFGNKYVDVLGELDRRIASIEQNLKRYNARVNKLGAEEVLKILYDSYNPGLKRLQPFSLSQDIASRGVKVKDLICPSSFRFRSSQIEIGTDYKRILFIRDLPNSLTDRFIGDLLSLNFNVDISIHLENIEPGDAMRFIRRRITSMEADKILSSQKGKIPPFDLEYNLEAARKLLHELQANDKRLFCVGIYICLTSSSIEQLEHCTKVTQGLCSKHGIKALIATHRQELGLNSVLPFCSNKLNVKRQVLTDGAAILLPFTAQDVFSNKGIFYGINKITSSLVVFDRKNDIKNPSGFILGTPGSGKTMTAKAELYRVFLCTDDDIIIIDPEREYFPVVKELNGEIVTISANSETHINPFDMEKDYGDDEPPLKLKGEFLIGIFDQLIGPLKSEEKAILDRVTRQTYKDYINSHFKPEKIPTMNDYFEILKKQPEQEAQRLALSLELYVQGSLSIFSEKTNVNLSNRLICFDINRLGDQLKPLGMQVVLDNIWNRIVSNREKKKRTWLYMDEIYLMFNNEYSGRFLYELYKRTRKYGGIPTGITQNVEDLLKSDIARSMLSNSQFIILMDQAASDRKQLADILQLSQAQLNYVTNSDCGHGLIVAGGLIVPCKFEISEKEYRLMTTKPEEFMDVG
ncbi:MAG: VirB4-like conjugal transfer ATPase, CD1110 family [Ignavibacteriales bacterium]